MNLSPLFMRGFLNQAIIILAFSEMNLIIIFSVTANQFSTIAMLTKYRSSALLIIV